MARCFECSQLVPEEETEIVSGHILCDICASAYNYYDEEEEEVEDE